MQHGPIHQDWTPVILKKNSKNTSMPFIPNPAGHKAFLKLDSDDIPKISYVSKEEAQNVISARKAKNLKQEELAKLLNMNVSVIKDFESQKLQSNKQLYGKLLRALNVKIEKS